MIDALKQYANIDFSKIKTFENAKLIASKYKVSLQKHFDSIGFIMNACFEELVEKQIVDPTFITDYPIEISPFAKKTSYSEKFTERFELFIAGGEYANAFTEITDHYEQIERFKNQKEQQEKGNLEVNSYDADFIDALKYGMPPTGGIGIGIDRLVMLLTNCRSIKDVILFPTLKKDTNA